MFDRKHVIEIGLPILTFALGIIFGYATGHVNHADLVDRQRMIHEHYPDIYPFDSHKARHIFHEHDDGGMIQIRTNASSTEEVALIRSFLNVQYDRYRTGNFHDEAELHGAHMPGIKELSEHASEIQFVYNDLPDGAQIQLITKKRELIDAIHIWFRAQLLDHGADAESHMEGMGEDLEIHAQN